MQDIERHLPPDPSLMKSLALILLSLAATLSTPAMGTSTRGGFMLTSVALYQPDPVLRERMGADATPLSNYIKALQAEASAIFSNAERGDGLSGSIVVAVKPGGQSRVWLVLGQNKLDPALREALIARLQRVQPVVAVSGPIAFALNFNAWGAGTPILQPAEHIPIPEEWKAAMKGQPAGVMPDAPLEVLWP
jgi:hypothetical protein